MYTYDYQIRMLQRYRPKAKVVIVMRIARGPLKLTISKRGIAYKWNEGNVHRFSFEQFSRKREDDQSENADNNGNGYGRYDSAPQYDNDGYPITDPNNWDRYADNSGAASGQYEDRPDAVLTATDLLYHNDMVMWALLILLPPLGVWILMQHKERPTFVIRLAISVASIVWFVIMIVWLASWMFGGNADPTSAQFTPGAQPTPSTTMPATAFDPTEGGTPDMTVTYPDTTQSDGTVADLTQPDDSGAVEDPTVYATASSMYYHKTKDCSNISGEASPLLLSRAKANNRQACSVCYNELTSDPNGGTAANSSKLVWATRTGTYYHDVKDCTGMKGASQITLARATTDGKRACPTCTVSYFYNANGTYVHKKSNCSKMTGAKKVTYAEARKTGKPACPVCVTGKATTLTTTNKKATPATTTKKATTYYATTAGKHYHTKINCTGMKGAAKITLDAAKKAKKTPCPTCVATTTTTASATYYSTLGGKSYHMKSNCSGMKGATKVTLATAKKRGQTPCTTCIPQASAAKTQDDKAIYYGTTDGKYYHTSATCSGMKGAKKITLATALKNNKKPCPTCFKKAAANDNNAKPNTYVYANKEGTYYHSKTTCSGMKDAPRVTLATAVSDGKKACPYCMKRTYYYSTTNSIYYHKTATCSGMRNASRLTLASAKAKSKLACPVCILKKASSADMNVGTYIVKGGKYYHKNQTCNNIKGAKKVTLAYAKGSGRTACPRCVLKKENTTANADKKVACYLLKKGTYYHASKSCESIKGKSGIIKTSVYTAKKRNYKICSKCVDKNHTTYVFVTSTGLYYHKGQTCGAAKNNMKLSLKTAVSRAYKRCPKCDPPAAT